MNSPSSPRSIHTDDEPTLQPMNDSAMPLRIAIIYDGIPAGRRAMAMVRRIVDQAGEPTHLMPSIWRFDLLDDPGHRRHAIADAVAADLLILATERPDALPANVESWVSDFLARRRGTPVSMVAMWGPEEEWTISLYERNAAGRVQPTNVARSRPAPSHLTEPRVKSFDTAMAAA